MTRRTADPEQPAVADEPERERTWRWPWEPIPGDDGYLWSLRMARFGCGCLLAFPVLFALFSWAIIAVVADRHEEPVITAFLAILALTILPAAPFIRERVARVGISAHLAGDRALRRPRAVYAGFATATITGFLVAQVAALFGFIVTALTREMAPLLIGSVISYGVWGLMWPRRLLWDRWTWQARLRRDEQPS